MHLVYLIFPPLQLILRKENFFFHFFNTSFCNQRELCSVTTWFAEEIFSPNEESILENLSSFENGLMLYIYQSFSIYFLWINWEKKRFKKVTNSCLSFFFIQFLKSEHFLKGFFTIINGKSFIKIQFVKLIIY